MAKVITKVARDIRTLLIDSKIVENLSPLNNLQLLLIYELINNLTKKLAADSSENGLSQEELEVLDCYYGTSFSKEMIVNHIQMTDNEISARLGKLATKIRKNALKKLQKAAENAGVTTKIKIISIPEDELSNYLNNIEYFLSNYESIVNSIEKERDDRLQGLELKKIKNEADEEKIKNRKLRVTERYDLQLAEIRQRKGEYEHEIGLVKNNLKLRDNFCKKMEEVINVGYPE